MGRDGMWVEHKGREGWGKDIAVVKQYLKTTQNGKYFQPYFKKEVILSRNNQK